MVEPSSLDIEEMTRKIRERVDVALRGSYKEYRGLDYPSVRIFRAQLDALYDEADRLVAQLEAYSDD